jgi:hypothetical protein
VFVAQNAPSPLSSPLPGSVRQWGPFRVQFGVLGDVLVENRQNIRPQTQGAPRMRVGGGPAPAGDLSPTPNQPWLPPATPRRPSNATVRHAGGVVSIDDVRAIASALPRSYEVTVADRVKFRVGRIVFLAFSRDEKTMGFGFPKEEREPLVSSEPHKFQLPSASDMRYNWVHVRLDAIDHDEMRELVLDAWQMVVPKKVATEYLGHPPKAGPQ